MSWTRMFYSLLESEQRNELTRLINDPQFISTILDSGHSDIHYFGSERAFKIDWEKMFDRLYERDDPEKYYATTQYNNLPTAEEIQWQLTRIANEHVHCSTFVDRETALTVVHEMLSIGRNDLLSWLREDTNRTHTLVLRGNLNTIIGTGVTRSGNERASSTCALILDREPCHINGECYPFSIRTCYPDITNEAAVEGVWSTGRSFATELQGLIAQTSPANQQRWIFDSYGEKSSMKPDYQGIPTIYLSRMYNNVSYYVGINETRTNAIQCVRFTSDEKGKPLNIAYQKGYENGLSADTLRFVGLDALRLFKLYQSKTLSHEFYKPELPGYLGHDGPRPSFTKEEI